MRILAFDLETIPDLSMIHLLPPVSINKTLKDPEKKAADILEKTEAQREMMGLEPMFNSACCIGWCNGESANAFMLNDYPGEKELLEAWWEFIRIGEYTHFDTFNGRAFDMRCLLLHGMKHGVRPSVDIDNGRYNRGNHTDLKLILSGDSPFAKGKLDLYAKVFLNDHKTEGIDGKMVADYWQIGAYDMVKKYCIKDCRITYALGKKARAYGLINN